MQTESPLSSTPRTGLRRIRFQQPAVAARLSYAAVVVAVAIAEDLVIELKRSSRLHVNWRRARISPLVALRTAA